MILTAYLVLIFFGLASIVIKFKRRYAYLYIIPVSIMWSLTMRTAALNADFTYYTFMMTQEEIYGVFFANINQPVLYSFHWFIHSLINNVYLTWVISDLILLFIFYHAIFNLFTILK